MPKGSAADLQAAGKLALARLFGAAAVESEWQALRGERGSYSPRLDLAVGPFATGTSRRSAEYDGLLEQHSKLLDKLWSLHVANLRAYDPGHATPDRQQAFTLNGNARCFLAIEIEHKVSRKHLMGGAINASALGRLGIVIGGDEEKTKALVKTRHYLLFLASVGKNTFNPANLLILSRGQLEVLLQQVRGMAG